MGRARLREPLGRLRGHEPIALPAGRDARPTSRGARAHPRCGLRHSLRMNTFSSFDGTTIVFDDLGEGPPVVMLHGFAADAHANWHQPKVVEAVVATGRRVITPDARGTGDRANPTTSTPTRTRRCPAMSVLCSITSASPRSISWATRWERASPPKSRCASRARALDRARRGRRGLWCRVEALPAPRGSLPHSPRPTRRRSPTRPPAGSVGSRSRRVLIERPSRQ